MGSSPPLRAALIVSAEMDGLMLRPEDQAAVRVRGSRFAAVMPCSPLGPPAPLAPTPLCPSGEEIQRGWVQRGVDMSRPPPRGTTQRAPPLGGGPEDGEMIPGELASSPGSLT